MQGHYQVRGGAAERRSHRPIPQKPESTPEMTLLSQYRSAIQPIAVVSPQRQSIFQKKGGVVMK